MKNKIPELGTELKQTHLTQHKIDVQGHDPIKQRYYHVSPKVTEKINFLKIFCDMGGNVVRKTDVTTL